MIAVILNGCGMFYVINQAIRSQFRFGLIQNNNLDMPPKQIIVVMKQDYPFGECEECTNQTTKVLVRKLYKIKPNQKKKILQKVGILRKLKNEYLINVQSVLEEEESIHILYEYIPIKLQTWISNINDQFIQNFRDQLIQLSEYLANYSIRIDFQLKNIGMDQNYGAKYFLDIDFETNITVSRQKLKSTYIKQINYLFKPYILTKNTSQIAQKKESDVYRMERSSKSFTKDSDRFKKQPVDSAISPPTNKPSASKNKEKALQKYYQEVNMSVDSENQKILQEFMDVLDNEEEDQAKNVPSPPPSQNKSRSQMFTQSQSNPMQKKFNNSNSPVVHYTTPQSQNNQPNSVASNIQKKTNSKIPVAINQSQQFKNYVQQNQYTTLSNNLIPLGAQNEYTNALQQTGRKSQNSDSRQKWRQSISLQSRVSSVIEKSRQVIKKFKTMKVASIK